jgi:hypothetical protein
MMDIHLTESDKIPLPPEQVVIRSLSAEVYPDGRRVKVQVEVTPFLERPMVELSIRDAQDGLLAESTIVECADASFSITMHLRGEKPGGEACVLEVELSYPDLELKTVRRLTFS